MARELTEAALNADVPCEFVFIEDGSTQYLNQNKSIAAHPGLSYTVHPENRGRSAIRNALAAKARYPWLLFLDCDVLLPDADLIVRYMNAAEKCEVICGGHIYGNQAPASRRLHHTYGLKRECTTAAQRREKPFRSFMSGNFFIRKSLFEAVKFDEALKEYGHEDTLFGVELRKRGARLCHIDNPVIHVALDRDEAFLEKSKQALRNALFLVKSGKIAPEEIRATETFYRLKKSAGGRAVLEWLIPSEDFLREQLLRPNPRISSLDFLKLAWLRDLEKEAPGKAG